MVAQRKTHSRCKAAVYLSLLYLCACTDDQYTVVELHHTQPSELTEILDKQLGDAIEYSITGQTIVFYTDRSALTPTIALLQQLDKPTAIYSLTFSWLAKKRYSTTQLPKAITVQTDQPNLVSAFDHNWNVSIVRVNQTQVLVSFLNKEKRRKLGEQQYMATIGELKRIEHPLFPEGIGIIVTLL